MIDPEPGDLQASYDRVAQEYARQLFHELDHKPLDRQFLDRFADRVRSIGVACDIGCGPGQVAAYLHQRGAPVIGLDLSPAMVAQARELNSEIAFYQGDMRALTIPDQTWGGIVAFYALIHLARTEVVATLTEWRRVLRPGGPLLLAWHLGDHTLHRDEWWGHPVSVDFRFFGSEEIINDLNSAGFQVGELVERNPYPDVEYPSRRAYLFAENPGE